MKFFSPGEFLQGAGRTAKRFPLVLIAALMAGVCAAILVENEDWRFPLRALLGAQLGIPLLIALSLFAERLGRWRLSLNILGAILLGLYASFLSLPFYNSTMIRFVQLNVAAHLLVAFLPYLRRHEHEGFWQYNKTLFLRILNSLLFTAVLVIGLNIAMLALDQLFGLEIPGEAYARLDLLLLFIFNTWHFLGGVPKDFASLNVSREFPKGLRIFAQYILAPLVAVYLAILMAYLLKVLISSEWPSGWIGWLVSSVGAAGLLSLALLHPVVARKEVPWVAVYSRVYFVLMIPALGMQLMALGKRIGQYGFTEPRYFLLVLALWLLVISVLGALNRLKRLEPLPATLCAIALLTCFGPWGAYGFSRDSQVDRLEAQLSDARLLEDGKLVRAAGDVDAESRREISAILHYLTENHGHEPLLRWLDPEQSVELEAVADTVTASYQRKTLSERFMGFADLNYVENWRRPGERRWYSVEHDRSGIPIALDDYGEVLPINLGLHQVRSFTVAGRELEIVNEGQDLVVRQDDTVLLTLSVGPICDELEEHLQSTGGSEAPGEMLFVEAARAGLRLRLHVSSMNWQREKAGPRLRHIAGFLLIGH